MEKPDIYCRFPLVAACDIESTLTPVEGWNFLAQTATKEIRERVEQLTAEGQNGGGLSFEEYLRARFDLLKPGRKEIDSLRKEYLSHIDPDARKIIALLQKKFQRVVCISGGLQDAILPFTEEIGISQRNVFAIPLTPQGKLPDHHPLYASDGKKLVLHGVIAEELAKHDSQNGNGFYNIMIGDGMTDAATRGENVTFIAIGNRENVIKMADFHGASLGEILDVIREQIQRLTLIK